MQPHCDVQDRIFVRVGTQSTQTARTNYLFNWVALTGRGKVITLTNLIAIDVGINQQTPFQWRCKHKCARCRYKPFAARELRRAEDRSAPTAGGHE